MLFAILENCTWQRNPFSGGELVDVLVLDRAPRCYGLRMRRNRNAGGRGPKPSVVGVALNE